MKTLTAVLMLINTVGAAAQAGYPPLPERGHTFADFLPPDYILLDTTFGDFNQDNLPDVALVIEGLDSLNELRGAEGDEESVRQRPRILLICFGDIEGFRLVERNNGFILRAGEGGPYEDPYNGLTSNDKGHILLEFYFSGSWHGNLAYTFAYSDAAFRLIAAESTNQSRSDGAMDTWEFDFSGRTARHTTGNALDDNIEDTHTVLELNLPALRTFGDLRQAGTWQVFDNVYL